MQQENDQTSDMSTTNNMLSEVWQQLLGNRPLNADTLAALRESIPTLASDPWSALLQAKGVEVVDLEQLHLHLSDQDLEQMLQLMQEQTGAGQNGPDSAANG
jgi:ketopantoate reductase